MKIRLLKDRDGDIWVERTDLRGGKPLFGILGGDFPETEDSIARSWGPIKELVIDAEEDFK